MKDAKNRIEAVLFSSGKKMPVEEISKLTRIPSEEARQLLQELKADYDSKDSSLFLSDEGDGWKLTTREQYASVVRKIVAETELTRSLMETLAVIAWKAPVLQSEVIRVRTNKAYDHLSELEDSGFISRAKHGRTKLIKLTERFFSYFDLRNADEVREKFRIREPEQQKTLVEAEGSHALPPENATGEESSASESAAGESNESQASQPKEASSAGNLGSGSEDVKEGNSTPDRNS